MSKVRKSRMVLCAAIAACALAVVGLAGCGGGANEANSAEEVYEHYSQNANDNYIMDGDIKMSVSAQGMSMDIPMKMHIETSNKEAYTEMSTSMWGMDANSKSYIVKDGNDYVTYSCSTELGSDKETWTKETSTEGTESIEKLANFEKSMFEGAEFAKTADGYTVNVSMSKMMTALEDAADSSGGEVQEMIDSMTAMGVNPEDIKVSFLFDKDYNLTKIAIPETEIPFDSQGVSGKMVISCDITLSNHGNVQKIVVPDDVIKNATEGGSFIDDTASTLMNNAGSASSAAGGAAAEAATGTNESASSASASDSASSASSDSSSDTVQKKAA